MGLAPDDRWFAATLGDAVPACLYPILAPPVGLNPACGGFVNPGVCASLSPLADGEPAFALPQPPPPPPPLPPPSPLLVGGVSETASKRVWRRIWGPWNPKSAAWAAVCSGERRGPDEGDRSEGWSPVAAADEAT